MFHSHFHFVCDRHEEFKSSLHSRSYLSQSYSYSNYNLISNESKQKRITPCLVVPISFFFLRRLLLKSDIVWHQLDKTYNPLVFSLSLSSISSVKSLFFQNITHRKRTTLAAQTIILFFYSCRWMDRDQPFHVLYRCTYSAPLPRLLDPPICFRSPGPPYFLFVSLRNPLHCMRPGSPGLFSGKGGGARESLLPAEIGKYL